jgi:hypothetical protein
VSSGEDTRIDRGEDNIAERVVRNEGELQGLRSVVEVARQSDRELVDHKSNTLAEELERTTESLRVLAVAQREADLREHREALAGWSQYANARWEADHRAVDLAVNAVRELMDSRMEALEQRRIADTSAVRDELRQTRASDKEALSLVTESVDRRLAELNHNRQTQKDILAGTVSRELFDTHMGTVNNAIADLKTAQDATASRTAGMGSLVGWAVAGLGLAVTLLTAVILIANYLTGRA